MSLNTDLNTNNLTLYTSSVSQIRSHEIDMDAKKLKFSQVTPIKYPEELVDPSHLNEWFTIVRQNLESPEENSPFVRVYKQSLNLTEQKEGKVAEFLGEIDLRDSACELELIWVFEISLNFISRKFSFLYSMLDMDSISGYYLGSISENHKNCLKKYFSLNFNFSHTNNKMEEKIQKDSSKVEKNVRTKLHFKSWTKIFSDDFPANEDQRYCTFTFVEKQGLIATVFSFRNRKILKKSLITPYELFNALGFSSIYHSKSFSIDECTYSYKLDRMFFFFKNSVQDLDEDNPHHHDLLRESRGDDTLPHVYMNTRKETSSTQPFMVEIQGVGDYSKRRLRVLNNSLQKEIFKLPKDLLLLINTVDFENKLRIVQINESTGEEKKMILSKTDETTRMITHTYGVDEKHFILADTTHYHLVDFDQGKVLSSVRSQFNFSVENLFQDEDVLVHVNDIDTSFNLFQLDEDNLELKHLYEFNVRKDLRSVDCLEIDRILAVKKISAIKILVFLKASVIPYKNRCEIHQAFIELLLSLDSEKKCEHQVHELDKQIGNGIEAQFVQNKIWKLAFNFWRGIKVYYYSSLLTGEGKSLNESGPVTIQRSALGAAAFEDVFFLNQKREQGSLNNLFIILKSDDYLVKKFCEIILNPAENEGEENNFTLVKEKKFNINDQLAVSKKLDSPLFFCF